MQQFKLATVIDSMHRGKICPTRSSLKAISQSLGSANFFSSTSVDGIWIQILHFFHQCRSTSMAHLLEQKSPQSTSEASAESPSAKTNTGEWSNTCKLNSTHSTNSFHWLQGSPLQSCDCSSWVVGRHREEDQRDNKWDHQRVLGCLAGLSVKNGNQLSSKD